MLLSKLLFWRKKKLPISENDPPLEKLKLHIPRIETFDIMRGFFLLAILNDHIHYFPNFFDWWGMRGQLLVSSAEGFFLLSGIVLGIVRGAKLIHEPFKLVVKLLLKRAAQLYITYIITVIGFTLVAWAFYSNNPIAQIDLMPGHDIWPLIHDTLTFHYFYGWADYLRFYALYIAVSPLAFWLLRKGQWYIVLAASAIVWLMTPSLKGIDWTETQFLQLMSWQPLFFIGIVVGFHWPQLAKAFKRHQKKLTTYVLYPMISLGAVLLLANIFIVFAVDFIPTDWTRQLSEEALKLRDNMFLKEQMDWPRIALFMLWFWSWFFVVEKFLPTIKKYLGWLLIPIGTNSLYVYTVSAFFVFFIHIYIPDEANVFINFAIITLSTALIYWAVKRKFLMKIIPR
ncbi:OpgC domain-containing protein [Candidatus Saccharibacteria bacterium]|nr:OpgC domain-containing protein [Candidatus Saccharibacteria bacterium]